jgi:hypothetical protein
MKTLAEAGNRVINDAVDRMHAAHADKLLSDASFATARHDAASLELIADKIKVRAKLWTQGQGGAVETALRESGE